MPNAIDQRPPVAVGHVLLDVVDVGAAASWLPSKLAPLNDSSKADILRPAQPQSAEPAR
jgi:hypothetical protein